jgi:3-keto-disaccharide hydrolase
MKRAYTVVFGGALALALLAPVLGRAQDGWQSLFNGKDLTGWKANYYPESARVEGGAIRLQSIKDRVHLFYVGDNSADFVRFKNFELKLRARGEPNSNSGVFFHTDFSVRDKRMHLGTGYELNLNNSPTEKRKTGSLYAIEDITVSPIADETKWFDVHLIVRGNTITIKLNGETTVEYTEPPNPERPPSRVNRLLDPNGGAIALQAHDPNSIFYFKDVRIKVLPD